MCTESALRRKNRHNFGKPNKKTLLLTVKSPENFISACVLLQVNIILGGYTRVKNTFQCFTAKVLESFTASYPLDPYDFYSRENIKGYR